MERIVIPPYDTYGVATLVIQGDLVLTGHFGGSADDAGARLAGIAAQTRQTFSNLERALQATGLRLADVLKVTVILRDICDFDGMPFGRNCSRRPRPRARPSRATLWMRTA